MAAITQHPTAKAEIFANSSQIRFIRKKEVMHLKKKQRP